MESVGERRAMENGGGTMRRLPDTGLVMCSTCSGFLLRMKRTSVPKPDEEVLEVVREAEKMRALMKAVLLHGPLQEIEPAEATKEQWKVLQRRRGIMMETKKCPTCFGSLLEACPTCFRSLLQKPGPDEEDKAMVADPGSKAGSKEKMSSREEGSEFMAVLPSQGGKERMKIATEDEAMVADARSEQKLKRSREEGKRSSSGLKEKKKAKSEDKEGSGSKKKAKRSSESQSKEEAKMEDSESAVGNRKTKMVTQRLDKKSIDILKNQPPLKPPPICCEPELRQRFIDIITPYVEVDRVLHEYLQCHYSIKGYAEVQLEVTDDEGDDHKLV